MRAIANQGAPTKNNPLYLGGNYRLDTIMAAQLYHALGRLDAWNDRRRNVARIYNESFTSTQRPTQQPSSRHVYHLYEFCCMNVYERDRVEKALVRNQIGYGFHYPHLISDAPMYEAAPTPVANSMKDRLISLPMHPFMSEHEASEVVRVVRQECG